MRTAHDEPVSLSWCSSSCPVPLSVASRMIIGASPYALIVAAIRRKPSGDDAPTPYRPSAVVASGFSETPLASLYSIHSVLAGGVNDGFGVVWTSGRASKDCP